MKKFRRLAFCMAFAGLALSSSAQINQVDFIKGGINDAQILFEQYLTPYANSFGANLNAGWYNTAKPHKLGGFDVTVTVNTAWAPDVARTFDMATLGLDASIDGTTTIAPTAAAKRSVVRPDLVYNADYAGSSFEVARYQVPGGSGVNAIPLPMAQLGIGLPWGTDVTVRYLPELDLGKFGSIGLWGVGLKHSILQHIPLFKRLPVLEASVQGGYTDLSTFANIDFQPVGYEFLVGIDNLATFFDGQKITLGVQSWTANIVFSQTLPIITFYQAIGYSSSNTSLALTGKYPINRLVTSPSDPQAADYLGKVIVDYDETNLDGDAIVTDPFNIEIQNTKDLRLNAGFRIKLGVLTFHFDYTKANYSVFTGGIGISFR